LGTVYLGAVAVNAERLVRKSQDLVRRDLVRATLVIHLSYGMGFVVGLVRFFLHWFRAWPSPPALAARDPKRVSRGVLT
jgi:hypothetical protein